MPIFLNRSASFMGHTMASSSSSICFARPPTSVYFSVGFSSTSMALTLLSYSAGSVSRTRYESLFTPMRSPGDSLFGSTRPMRGRKMVCLVDVLMTADLPTRVASRSMLAPSSDDSAVGSRSRSSTTLPTRYGSWLCGDGQCRRAWHGGALRFVGEGWGNGGWWGLAYRLLAIFSMFSLIFSAIVAFSCDNR